MPDEKNVLNLFEIKKATADISDIKEELKYINHSDRKQDKRINDLEKKQAVIEQKLNTIIETTERTRNSIQNAIYGAIATGVIGGGITIVWAYLGGS